MRDRRSSAPENTSGGGADAQISGSPPHFTPAEPAAPCAPSSPRLQRGSHLAPSCLGDLGLPLHLVTAATAGTSRSCLKLAQRACPVGRCKGVRKTRLREAGRGSSCHLAGLSLSWPGGLGGGGCSVPFTGWKVMRIWPKCHRQGPQAPQPPLWFQNARLAQIRCRPTLPVRAAPGALSPTSEP